MEIRKFVKNAAIMTVTALILRAVGMFFRIYLSNKIGAEGMGLYQLIFSVYVLVATFATSGISTAVTRLIADELICGTRRSVGRILRRSVLLTLIIAAVSTAAVLLLADVISVYWIKDARASDALRILSLSLPFMGVSSCLRGYFIACRRAGLPSGSQMFEQLVRIGVIAVIIDSFCERGIGAACTAVLIGDTVAEAASCCVMFIGYLRDRRLIGEKLCARKNPPYGVVRQLLKIAVPISAGRYLTTLLRTVENLMVPEKLSLSGMSKELSLSQFGMLKGMALPLLLFPSSFLTALSTLLIPELSSASAQSNDRAISSAVDKSVGITLSASMIVGGLFLLFGRPLGLMIYGSDEVGAMISALSPLIPLMYLENVVDGMLKGLDQQMHTFGYNLLDSGVRIVLIILIVPRMGMTGFLLVMAVSNALTSLLCIARLLRVSSVSVRWGDWLIRPLLCTAGACIMSRGLYSSLPAMPLWLSVWLAMLTGLAAYFGLMAIFGGIRRPAVIKGRKSSPATVE